jgi:hypothetical protein
VDTPFPAMSIHVARDEQVSHARRSMRLAAWSVS